MEDPVIKALGINFVYCIEMKLNDADMYEVNDVLQQKNVQTSWAQYIDHHLASMRALEEIRKIRVVAKGDENTVIELDKSMMQQIETILLLLPLPPKNKKGLEKRKKGASSSSNTESTEDWEILVKITADKWGDKPLYLGLGFHDLYWKWFLGGSFRYIFKTKEEKKEIDKQKLLPPNTKILVGKTSYQELLGIKRKTTGKLNFEGRNFVTSLSDIHGCESDEGPKSSALAYLIIYMIEAVRFSALRSMDMSLFRLRKTDTHPWDDYILDLVNDWGDYSKQLFKYENPSTNRTIIDPFYNIHKFCGLSDMNVTDKSGIHRILAVALGTDDSNEWIEIITKAKDKTKSRKRR